MLLEQFVIQLSEGTVEWVQCHWPVNLEEVVQLVEDHLDHIYPGAGSASLSPYLPLYPHTGWTPRECRSKAWTGVLALGGVQAFLRLMPLDGVKRSLTCYRTYTRHTEYLSKEYISQIWAVIKPQSTKT